MNIIEITMNTLSICVAILAVVGTIAVIIASIKSLYELLSDFLKNKKAQKEADSSDDFHLKTLDDAVVYCHNKKNNSFCNYDNRASYAQLEAWLVELNNLRDNKILK